MQFVAMAGAARSKVIGTAMPAGRPRQVGDTVPVYAEVWVEFIGSWVKPEKGETCVRLSHSWWSGHDWTRMFVDQTGYVIEPAMRGNVYVGQQYWPVEFVRFLESDRGQPQPDGIACEYRIVDESFVIKGR